MSEGRAANVPPPLVAIAGWVVPGLGYWLIGQRGRAVTVFVAILALFFVGVLVAGIRVIDVPGYSEDGEQVLVAVKADGSGQAVEYRSSAPGARWVATDPQARWVLTAHPVAELLNKPWYIGQVLAGPVTLVASKYSIDLSRPTGEAGLPAASKAHVRIAEIGTLYTAVAGMLNLLVMIDAAHRAGRKEGGA
jgi:hypothetical protein